MRFGLGLAATAVAALLSGAAHAQSSMVNGVKVSEIEAGVTLWYASTKFSTNLQSLGTPVSALNWGTVSNANAELNLKINSLAYGISVRATGGGGIGFGGKLTDDDYDLTSHQLVSSTSSGLSKQGNYYFGADVMWTPGIEDGWRFKISPVAGIFYFHETFDAQGLSCNMASNLTPCPTTGSSGPAAAGVTATTDLIRNDISFWAPKVGAAASFPITSQLTLTGEGSYLFFGHYKNNDSHNGRTCDPGKDPTCQGFGPSPNIVDTATSGSGYQLQAMLDYKFAESKWTIGGGVRYWKFDSGNANSVTCAQCSAAGQAIFSGVPESTTNTITMMGVLAHANYQF